MTGDPSIDAEASGAPEPSPTPPRRLVAAFDFDGTLTRHDTLVPFLAKVAGWGTLVRSAARTGLAGIRGKVSLGDRDGLKELMIADLLSGRSEAELHHLGRTFAEEILAKRMNADVLTRLEQHVEAGHEVILVSASLVYYLDPIAEKFGLDAVIAVEPTVVNGTLDGTLSRPNVRAEQKAVRLAEWLAQTEPSTSGAIGNTADQPDVELWAYGNSSGDLALLAEADNAFWLGPRNKMPADAVAFTPVPLEF